MARKVSISKTLLDTEATLVRCSGPDRFLIDVGEQLEYRCPWCQTLLVTLDNRDRPMILKNGKMASRKIKVIRTQKYGAIPASRANLSHIR